MPSIVVRIMYPVPMAAFILALVSCVIRLGFRVMNESVNKYSGSYPACAILEKLFSIILLTSCFFPIPWLHWYT